MCEASVYINRASGEELLMEKVDRIVPGEDQTVFMENIFGERKVVKARIREMELVHHRVVLDEIREEIYAVHEELWLEPSTDHGHFHEGEQVTLKLLKGYNMKPGHDLSFTGLKAFVASPGGAKELHIHDHHGSRELVLGEESDGLLQVWAEENEDGQRHLASVLVEVGHHHHHGLKPVGLDLEIFPTDYSHARMGESYEIQVLQQGEPLAGVEVRATFAATHQKDYPHRMVTNDEGKVRLFLTARGNYLFSVSIDDLISTFTLVKSF
ncbi:MAG: CooT family nickel-binding protein [Deltaproteobacteria bacterium]